MKGTSATIPAATPCTTAWRYQSATICPATHESATNSSCWLLCVQAVSSSPSIILNKTMFAARSGARMTTRIQNLAKGTPRRLRPIRAMFGVEDDVRFAGASRQLIECRTRHRVIHRGRLTGQELLDPQDARPVRSVAKADRSIDDIA